MKCEEAEGLMMDYLENTLSNEQREAVENHLGTCERCLDELKDSKELIKIMAAEDTVKQDDSLRINFYHMLHSEIEKAGLRKNKSPKIQVNPWYRQSRFNLAAGIALLICGTFIGMFIRSEILNSTDRNELRQLHSEVAELNKTALITMLKDESSSDRIMAVNYVDDLDNPGDPVIEVLFKTLNTDKNTNVRMAAAYALSKFAGQRSVSDSLVRSLTLQTDPILQVALINILVERKEKSAVKPIEDIIANKSTLKEVKQVAEDGVKRLI